MRTGEEPRPNRLSLLLFLCLFSSQSGVLVLSPILVELAREFDVTTTTAGQLRTISGFVAGIVALVVGRATRRASLRGILRAGLGLLATGSLLSATAPSFAFLAVAQIPVGIGIALVLSAAVAAPGEWVAPEARSRVLSWTLIGNAGAWIVGMPVIGAVSGATWRWAWIAVPFAASVLASAVVARFAPRSSPSAPEVGARSLFRESSLAVWATAELLAFTAWTGILVYAGALLVESYGATVGITGTVLGAIALPYVPGNFLFRRWLDRSARELMIGLSLAGAVLVALIGMVRPSLLVSGALLASFAFVNGGRTIAGSFLGLQLAPESRVAAMGLRTAANQFGYLLGAAVGGVALSLGGYRALGLALAVCLLAVSALHLWARASIVRRDAAVDRDPRRAIATVPRPLEPLRGMGEC